MYKNSDLALDNNMVFNVQLSLHKYKYKIQIIVSLYKFDLSPRDHLVTW